ILLKGKCRVETTTPIDLREYESFACSTVRAKYSSSPPKSADHCSGSFSSPGVISYRKSSHAKPLAPRRDQVDCVVGGSKVSVLYQSCNAGRPTTWPCVTSASSYQSSSTSPRVADRRYRRRVCPRWLLPCAARAAECAGPRPA